MAASERMTARSPVSLDVRHSVPRGPATAKQTMPTGFSAVPPPGPAMPVMATATSTIELELGVTPVTISGKRIADAILLSVIDEGPGIPVGAEKKVFDTFTRLEGSDRVKHGTGLGLAIVKGFAEAMGLGVDASTNSEPRGACFTLRIPEHLIITDFPGEPLS